jgi:hypothetical protein
MNTRTLHRVIGLVMLLPFLGWAVTGAIFFLKPGYAGAYESLAIKNYPLGDSVAIAADASWLEFRVLKTILGEHLLVRTDGGWQHLDPRGLRVKPAPGERDLRALLTDAFSANPARYGRIVSVDGLMATTDTGIRVTLAWNRLTLSQRGTDTDRIDTLYKVHYLQWTGIRVVDQILGSVGLALILVLSVLGLRLFLKR